ncbi:hypothetical protein C7S20_09020 [Christiangramia fulva]|uniref:histidine kinase n=1 Tax=Christiangramia fulva TaxID=2126553 RepID=A0A2R3Z558_9FLAO|nr:sensor histidine kinase [Christiangramia fulva]AVR45401.1 hypothetical protein C7S20_09020 [Christiangramia fulva]
MKYVSPLIQCFLLLVLATNLSAQNTGKEALYFQTYTIEDGLADNKVFDLTQDHYGYVWIATGSGVSRFDGYEFINYRNDPEDSTSLSANGTFHILSDRDNNIWVVTFNGLNKFDRSSGNFHRYKHDPADSTSLPDDFIRELYESKKGTLWIGSETALSFFDAEDKTFKEVLTSADSKTEDPLIISSITEDKDGKIWVASLGNGIMSFDPETGQKTHININQKNGSQLSSKVIQTIFIDDNDILWGNYLRRDDRMGAIQKEVKPGTPSGLWKKDLKTGVEYTYIFEPEKAHPLWFSVSDIIQTKDGRLWFSQSGGAPESLVYYDRKADSFFGYSYDAYNPGSIAWSFATTLLEDSFGNLWVGTSRGLNRTRRNKIQMKSFVPVPENSQDLTNNIYGITGLGENRYGLTSDGAPLIIWNRSTNTWSRLESEARRVPMIYDGNDKAWYVSEDFSINKIDLNTLKTKSFGVLPNHALVKRMLKLADETLVIGGNGLWTLDEASGQFHQIELKGIKSDRYGLFIPWMDIDSKGTLWFIAGNVLLDSTKTNYRFTIAGYNPKTGTLIPPKISKDYINAFGNGIATHIFKDSRERLWVSKSNGLVQLDSTFSHIKIYNQTNGLQYPEVLGTIEDDQGMIWISTRYGISRLNPSTGSIRNYGRDDGLRPSRMNEGAIYKNQEGVLFFGGVGGITYFKPDTIQEISDPPPIRIESMHIGEDQKTNILSHSNAAKDIEVDWDSNSINIEYVSINYSNPDETTYSYQLEGFQNNWMDAGKRQQAQFSNLPEGDYTFKVKAVNADGLGSKNSASVSFSILPPWWRTWWAYTFYIVLLIAAIIAADRIQRRKVQQKEREKARKKELEQAQEIKKAYLELEEAHHNLQAAQKQLVQQEKLASLGQLTAGIAHEIKNPLNFVNNFSEVSNELIDEACDELKKLDDSDAKKEILAILQSVKGNLNKVHQHGSRANGIVTSMLQHSRGGEGKREPTDLNALIKEYVNLSFHGMRASKNPINVKIEWKLEKEVGMINLISEDFSRVIVNLCNNAFDAMRVKSLSPSPGSTSAPVNVTENECNYEPKLTVRTRREENHITIEIEDNGPGIPEDLKDNIFQPFFTTKKGTEGTGLGLSITHDIINAHGGELKMETSRGKNPFTKFIIQLPN